MISKAEAKLKISNLVARFNEQIDDYKKTSYNETLVRRDFIDPMFKALGWDVDNEKGYAEAYREVIHEDKIKIDGSTQAPDYSFRLGGGKKLFFVEAKKPCINIKDEISPAYQIRRYGWNAKLPINIITDFEEFAIYDCTQKPNQTDKASHARLKYLTYNNYLAEFDFLWETFSKEHVLKGSFDKYVLNDKNKKGALTVDVAFLNSLDTWRTFLANNIALCNYVNEDELNFVVQHIIDRIIFLRIAEGRKVEPFGYLKNTIKNGNYYKNLLQLFKLADQKYNSGLFDFEKDTVSSKIIIDNKVIKNIITALYFPVSPYEFSVLSVEILGCAYEQFLGKQITLSKKGNAIIEEKPEVRKAGGVFYTPEIIVTYIVKNTLGKLIEGKTPSEISSITVLDPACGSGSFLIGAYQFLLDYHKDYYNKNLNLSKGGKDCPITPKGLLTTAEKKRILLNNIYGVDLDSNAVEVTKLSLLLKCMEGETTESISNQLSLFNTRILPTLDNNIKSGNSLIDIDFYNAEFDFGEERKIKPFNWQKAFPSVLNKQIDNSKPYLKEIANKAKKHAKIAMDYAAQLEEHLNMEQDSTQIYNAAFSGGFDVIIGNPPYVSIKALNSNPLSYFANKYITGKGQTDLYSIFIEKAATLLNKKGYLSFIVPDALNDRNNAYEARNILLKKLNLETVLTLNKVFSDASVGSTIFIASNAPNNSNINFIKTNDLLSFISNNFNAKILNKKDIIITDTLGILFVNSAEISLLKKIHSNHKTIKETCFLGRGEEIGKTNEIITSSSINALPFINGNDFKRYFIKPITKYIAKKNIKKDVLKLYNTKIIVRQVGKKITATLDNIPCITLQSVYTIVPNESLNIYFLLALINSNLFQFIYDKKFNTKEIFPRILIDNLKSLPIAFADVAATAEIIKHVETILALEKEVYEVSLNSQKEIISNRIFYCEKRINELVYGIYKLTKEEIDIVKAKN